MISKNTWWRASWQSMKFIGPPRFIPSPAVDRKQGSFAMVYSVQQIKYEILAYMKEFGGDFSEYYVGVSDDPENALFKSHQVDRGKDPWLYKQALTYQAARTAQDYFLSRLKSDGEAIAGGNEDWDCVYVYKKSQRTAP
tara:strand:- start:401 stop:817 length:417 start_codon:yes stop_codon:yes gene_type:complete